MKRLILTIALMTTIVSCKEMNTPIGQEDMEQCDCLTEVQFNNDGSWITQFIVESSICEYDGDTIYRNSGINREITICK